MEEPLLLTLDDGRTLAYKEYGDPDGFPVFGFHGTPGSRLWFPDNDPTAVSLGVRLITTDRPGYGMSSPFPERSIGDFSDDVRQLADHLQVDRFSVLGISGGGIYSAACAFYLQDRVFKAGLVSTTSEFEQGKPPKEMTRTNRLFFTLSVKFPALSRFLLNQQKKAVDGDAVSYASSARKHVQHLCPSDQEVMQKPGVAEAMHMHMREAYRQGVSGIITEAVLCTRAWGFDCSKIQVPLEIWHGTADTLAPISSIRRLVHVVPNSRTHFVENKGHFLDEDESVWERILHSVRG